ncbi:hypothetical protein [Candidatus Neptunochlamydia vexilliferae]|uniref:Uncharacterized protein n=1 Tax=Candidatus Neptunichlamydia vexilliferae TaxID=1651774 RepID=A0ABS0AYK8_9BACT|nr:hypothetical protein [Candidatus Neptunochlamydia vexilliferae]MBF5059219.1 hypothetical protein [Candidatus Neptunochlamydia vexilliferae]
MINRKTTTPKDTIATFFDSCLIRGGFSILTTAVAYKVLKTKWLKRTRLRSFVVLTIGAAGFFWTGGFTTACWKKTNEYVQKFLNKKDRAK